eukprot:gb/GEZN01001272.1/.p1 GENE.gb/GEZN01001272.1/~~gb/GEZN01001272.1/.p1  ORF type:complete len:971 (-),score=160.49 gb/GEZN01001272.1/:211-3123(-)
MAAYNHDLGAPLLPGGVANPVNNLLNPVRAAAGMVGMAMLGATGWAMRHLNLNSGVHEMSASGGAEPAWTPFMPKDDMEKVIVRPGPAGTIIAALPSLDGVTCLFSYGSLLDHDEKVKSFSDGAEISDAWIYGSKVEDDLAKATGNQGDVLKGRLICFPLLKFPAKLQEVDQFRGYNPSKPDAKTIRRAVVYTVKEDGTSKKAYWYYKGDEVSSVSAKDFKLVPVAPIKVLTWNLAAINNNPFEYHIDSPDPSYLKVMSAYQDFIENPGARDIPIDQVFTEQYYNQLMITMGKFDLEGVEEVGEIWRKDWKTRKIITGFIKDSDIENKRFVSMPDRITSSINTVNGPVNRPAVTNAYDGRIDTIPEWWEAWKEFMFVRGLRLGSKQGSSKRPYELLRLIRQPKYPLSKEEERISLPLQIMSLAIYDAIQVHIMNTVAPDSWRPLKTQLLNTMVNKKMPRLMEILSHTYADYDLICLQEVATTFIDTITEKMGKDYFTVCPEDMVESRDQNTVLLLKSSRFDQSSLQEVTDKVKERFEAAAAPPRAVGLGSGDLLTIEVRERSMIGGQPYLLTSFHGDANGHSTMPLLKALVKTKELFPQHKLILGIDANTYAKPGPGQLGVNDFATAFGALGFTTSVGDKPDPAEFTTSSARTFLQPAYSKAVKIEDRMTAGDHNPKDFIVFEKNAFKLSDPAKDNTGDRKFNEKQMFPCMDFPSDHAIVSAKLSAKRINEHPISLIVWDVDGTLAASRSLGYVVTNQVMEARGYPRISQKDYDLGTAYPTIGRMSFHITKTITDPIGEVLAKDFDIATVDVIKSGKSDVVLYPGAELLLKDIESTGSKQAVLSNGIGAYVRAILDVNHVSQYFCPVLGADMVVRPKPNPDGIIECSETLSIPLKYAVYIGDSPSDAKAARAAGIPSIGVSWGSHTYNELVAYFDVMCADFYSLREVLKAMGMPLPLPGRKNALRDIPHQ